MRKTAIIIGNSCRKLGLFQSACILVHCAVQLSIDLRGANLYRYNQSYI